MDRGGDVGRSAARFDSRGDDVDLSAWPGPGLRGRRGVRLQPEDRSKQLVQARRAAEECLQLAVRKERTVVGERRRPPQALYARLLLACDLHRHRRLGEVRREKIGRLLRQGNSSKRRSTIPSSTSSMLSRLSRITPSRLELWASVESRR
jgi:hypothetical protein